MKRKWTVSLRRSQTLISWYAKAGNKSTVARSFFFWTPWGTLDITGMERSYYTASK